MVSRPQPGLGRLAPPPAPPITVFSGHLAHAPAGDTVCLAVNEKWLKVPLSPAGDFRFELKELAAPLPVIFTYAQQRTRLYLVPGDQLRMTLEFTDFDKSLVYSGRGSDVNNYLARAQWKFEYSPPGDAPRPLDQLKPTTTPAEMRRNADAFRQQRLAFLANYAKAHALSAGFQREAQVAIAADWGMELLHYAKVHQKATPGEALPESYFDFLAELPMQELNQHFGRSITDNSLVANLVMGYQYRLAPAGELSPDPATAPRLYQLATAELGEGKIRDWVMRALLQNNVRSNLAGALAFYPTFRLHNRDSAVARNVRQQFAQRQQLSIGLPAPAFTLLDNTGKKVSLSDLRGKVVYLDFWGTWCAPCMHEMTEFAPALKKKFEGRDVVFLYISVGDPEAKWQQTLAAKQFLSANSVHVRSPTPAVATDYQVNGYPSYYLLDREGRFIDLYTSRPSDGAKTVAAIEQALAR